MTTTEVLVGVTCGVGGGLLVAIIFLFIYVSWKKRSKKKQARSRKNKTFDETKQRLIIKPENIPRFELPIFPQVPHKPVLPSSGTPDRLQTPIPKEVRQGRRGSVPLDQLITPSGPVGRRLSPTSPPSIFAINQQAIGTLADFSQLKQERRRKFATASSSSSSLLGKLEFSLYYDQDFQDLQVQIIRGIQVYQLGSIDDLSELAVTVAVIFEGKLIWKDKTKPVESCMDPDFNEQLTIHGLTPNQMRHGILKLTLLNNNSNSTISELNYPLSNVQFNFLISETIKLSEAVEVDETSEVARSQKDGLSSSDGELLVSMLYSPSDKKLTLGVECAKDLPVGNRGPPDSFVKVQIVFLGSVLHSRKTKVVPKDSSPEFNQEFEFYIEDDKLPQITVNLKLKNRGKMRDTRIGMIRLGYTADPCEPEYRHWEQVLHRPYMTIEKWHTIGKYH